MLELTLLGPPRVALDGVRHSLRPRRLALLAYLALEGPQSRGRLASLLFPDLESDEARGRLRLELHRTLHSALGPALRTEGEEVALEADCDLTRFERHLEALEYAEALQLVGGELLEGLNFDDCPPLEAWLETRRERQRLLERSAIEAQRSQLEASGDREGAASLSRTLLERQPLSEAACDGLTRALEALGRRSEALAEQGLFRERFRRELGLEPQLTHTLGTLTLTSPPGTSPAPIPRPSLREPPLVGREGLWQQLLEWYEAAPQVQILLLLGEGGVGKSRLAWAFGEHIDLHRLGGPFVPSLRAFEAEQTTPFEAVLEALRRAGSEAFVNLEPRWQATLAPLLPELFAGAGLGRPAPASEAGLLEALSQALRLISRGPGVAVFEDLHWLDASSVRAFAHADKRLRDQPDTLRFLATARPGELRRNLALSRWLSDLEREGRLMRLEVPPLSEVSVLRLIRQLSGSPRATGFAQKLHALSGGNPYALLAFVQGLVSRGHLETHAPDCWQLHLALSELDAQLPLTLREVLLSTLERAGEPVLRLLEAAALRGQIFEFDSAWAGSALGAEEAERALETALHHRWAQPQGDGLYRLEHDLLRQTLETSPEPPRAQAIHRRLAAHLDAVGAPSAARAHHWAAALEPGRAFGLWKEAAQEATALWAHREALHALERALDCTQDPLRRLEIHAQRCLRLKSLNDLSAWEREIDQADALIERVLSGAEREEQQLCFVRERTHLLWRSGDLEAALACSAPWVAGDLTLERILLLSNHGMVLRALGHTEQAWKVLQTAAHGLPEGETLTAANLYNALAQIAQDQGRYAIGLEYIAKAIEGFKAVAQKAGLASAYGNQAALYGLIEDGYGHQHSLEQALHWAQQSGNRHLVRACLDALCQLWLERGQGTQGLGYATQGLELCEEEADTAGIAMFVSHLRQMRGLAQPT